MNGKRAALAASLLSIGLSVGLVLAGLGAVAPSASAAAGTTASSYQQAGDVSAAAVPDEPADKRAAGKKQKSKKKYKVAPGVIFNHPFRRPWVIKDKTVRAIRHTRKGAVIRVMTWNFQASGITNSLIAAHKRGVAVRLFMARSLRNGEFWRLQSALEKGNKKRPKSQRSWAASCQNSCRGKGGAMHSKWVTISRAGVSDHVVMQGSANLTNSASVNQWNDWYTTVGDQKIFAAYTKIFTQARKDKRQKAYQTRSGDTVAWFAPRKKDLVLKLLNQVKCKGARKAGINGRTSIRIASSVIQADRGLRIANKLRGLHNSGCDIRLIYTLSTNKVHAALGGVPKRHLAYDKDGDGSYDDYLHMKSMAISGRLGDDRSARVVLNGSANWSGIGQISDEQGMIIRNDAIEKKYGSWINKIFNEAPLGRPLARNARLAGGVDPYANLELELPGQRPTR